MFANGNVFALDMSICRENPILREIKIDSKPDFNHGLSDMSNEKNLKASNGKCDVANMLSSRGID